MNTPVFLAIVLAVILASVLGNAFMKATTKQFSNTSTDTAFQGEAIRKEASQKADDTNERQRQMMENMKSRIDRNK